MFTLHCISIVTRNGKNDLSILTRENKKFSIELKESLLIMKDEPSLNRNITSAPWNCICLNSCYVILIKWTLLSLFGQSVNI